MSTQSEIMAITQLVNEINEIPSHPGVALMLGKGAVGVTAFAEDNEIDWQVNVYTFELNRDFGARLRFLRHELEQMRDQALGQQEKAA